MKSLGLKDGESASDADVLKISGMSVVVASVIWGLLKVGTCLTSSVAVDKGLMLFWLRSSFKCLWLGVFLF